MRNESAGGQQDRELDIRRALDTVLGCGLALPSQHCILLPLVMMDHPMHGSFLATRWRRIAAAVARCCMVLSHLSP